MIVSFLSNCLKLLDCYTHLPIIKSHSKCNTQLVLIGIAPTPSPSWAANVIIVRCEARTLAGRVGLVEPQGELIHPLAFPHMGFQGSFNTTW